MAMPEIGLFVRFGKVYPGRAEEAAQIFADASKYFGDKLAGGWLTYFEPFVFQTGDYEEGVGFFVMKGPEQKVFAILEDETRLELQARANEVVHHLSTELLFVGEDVLKAITRTQAAEKVLAAAR
jgi:hypothetical protein